MLVLDSDGVLDIDGLPPEIAFLQIDAAPIVGKSHRFPTYLESPSLTRRIATGALDGLTDD